MLRCVFVKVFVVVCFHFQKYMSVTFLPIHAVHFSTCTFFATYHLDTYMHRHHLGVVLEYSGLDYFRQHWTETIKT